LSLDWLLESMARRGDADAVIDAYKEYLQVGESEVSDEDV